MDITHIRRYIVLFTLLLFTLALGAQNGSWMAALPDTVKVCRVSIPGTHDSGTAGVRFPMKHYARTQTLSISEQWDAGIRFFDIRPKLENGDLKIYHGPANCHITFAEVLIILKQKLDENPKEFCIVMTNSAGGGQTAVDMTMEVIRTVIPVQMLAEFKPGMTMADTRGKILFIHRNTPSPEVEIPGAVVRGWLGNGSSRWGLIVSASGKSSVLWAQDYFTGGGKGNYLDSKWDKVTGMIKEFATAPEGVWCINHMSGYTGTGVSTNISRNAKTTNARLLEYLADHKSPIGIIPMDFPSQELIDAIIRCNGLYLQ